MNVIEVLTTMAREAKMLRADRLGNTPAAAEANETDAATIEAVRKLVEAAKRASKSERVEWEECAPASYEVAEDDMEALRAALAAMEPK